MPAFPFGPGFFADWVDWEDWEDSSLSDINERRHRVRRDPFPAADRSHPLRRGSLDIDGRGVNAERAGDPFPHLGNVGSKAGDLAARSRSAGTVTFRFLGESSTIRTAYPRRSTSTASSVP